MSSHHTIFRALLGVFSALIVLISLTGAAANTFFHASIRTIDTGDALTAPTEPLRASQSPQNTLPSPTPTASEQAPTAPPATPQGKPLNFLIIGSDTREDQGKGFGSANQITGQRSDTTMLIHLNSTRSSAVVLSIPRDLWVTIPSCKTSAGTWTKPHEGRFNEAFSQGGAECTIRTIKEVTGVPVNHVIIVDFIGFQKMVDSAGGLTICTTKGIRDDKSGLVLTVGTHTLNGKEALALARTRYSMGDGSDISRIGRQQHIIKLFLTQLKQSGALTNPTTVYPLAQDALSSLTMDPELADMETFASLMTTAAQMNPDSVQYLTWPWVGRADGATVETNTVPAKAIADALLTDSLPLPASIMGTPTPEPSSTGKKNKKKLCADPIN